MHEFLILSFCMIGLTIYSEKDKNMDKLYLAFFCTLFCLMAALRGEWIGNDTHAYLELFKNIGYISFDEGFIYGRFEPGYLALNKALYLVSDSPQIIVIFSSVLFYAVLFFFIKHNANKYCLAIIFFFVDSFFRFSMSAIRQSLAITILITGMYFLTQRKFLIYFLFVAVAYSIHSSSIIAGVIYFLASFTWQKRTFIVVVVSSIVVALLGTFVQSAIVGFSDYSRYVGSIYDDGINVATIFLILMSLCCFLTMHFSYADGEKKDIFYRLEFVRLCILIISMRLNAIDRLAEYFTLFEIVGMTNAICRYKNANLKFWLVMGVVGGYIAYSYVWGVMRPEYQMVWPYKTFWM